MIFFIKATIFAFLMILSLTLSMPLDVYLSTTLLAHKLYTLHWIVYVDGNLNNLMKRS